MKIFFYFILILVLVYVVSFTQLSITATKIRNAGLLDGKLRACPATPNCVSSEEPGKRSYISPFVIKGDPDTAWLRLKEAVRETGGRLEQSDDTYLWASFRTNFWHFTDDTEFVLDKGAGIIRVRSASRVGKGDFGTNRKRVENLRKIFEKKTGGTNV